MWGGGQTINNAIKKWLKHKSHNITQMRRFPLVLTHIFATQSQVYKVQKERLHTSKSQ